MTSLLPFGCKENQIPILLDAGAGYYNILQGLCS